MYVLYVLGATGSSAHQKSKLHGILVSALKGCCFEGMYLMTADDIDAD